MSGGGVGAKGMGDALLDRGQRFRFSSLFLNVSDSNRTVFCPSVEVVAADWSSDLPSFLDRHSDSTATSGVCNNCKISVSLFTFNQLK